MSRRSSPDWDMLVYWSLDLETSGLDPRRDAILSAGMVPIREARIRWGERYYTLVHSDRFSLAALRTHQLLPSELAKAPELPDLVDEVATRLGEGPLLVHFASMDVPFLRRAFERAGRRWPRPEVVDTARLLEKLHQQNRWLEPHAAEPSLTLSEARRRLQLPKAEAHHALSDALATAELFLALRARLGARRLSELT